MSEQISRLIQVMDQLREKCPWDKEQTHQSLLKYLIEETYELVDAIESGDSEQMREELGDLLLQIIFHSRIAAEKAQFTIEDVAAGISDKLISRHPHVFGDTEVANADEVEQNWEALKSAEKNRVSVVEGIPLSQPALSWTSAVIERAKKKGLEVSVSPSSTDSVSSESIGELLLSVVALAQSYGIDPELALRSAGKGLIARVQAQEIKGGPVTGSVE